MCVSVCLTVCHSVPVCACLRVCHVILLFLYVCRSLHVYVCLHFCTPQSILSGSVSGHDAQHELGISMNLALTSPRSTQPKIQVLYITTANEQRRPIYTNATNLHQPTSRSLLSVLSASPRHRRSHNICSKQRSIAHMYAASHSITHVHMHTCTYSSTEAHSNLLSTRIATIMTVLP